MTDHPNLELLRRGYAAYDAGDMDTINELFHDDVVWHVAGRGPISGDYKGKEQVFGFFAKLVELSDGTSKVQVHDLLADDEHGVALVTESATRNGRSHEGQATHVLHLRDGKVTEFWDAQVDLRRGRVLGLSATTTLAHGRRTSAPTSRSGPAFAGPAIALRATGAAAARRSAHWFSQ